MASLAELARLHTDLDGDRLAHLQRLVASWGLLADFCFSDLLLFAPVAKDETRFVVLGQVRPTTSQTLYRDDWVAEVLDEVERPLVVRAYRLGEIIEGEINLSPLQERVRVLCIPVRYEGEMVAVLTRESVPSVGRQPGELERIYVEIFNRFARMIAAGQFPFDAEDAESEEAPRVGDGVLLLDGRGTVEYSSPNAVSALHRMGIHANADGMTLAELGFEETAVRTALHIGAPVTEEVERGPVTVLVRCIPLLETRGVTGAVVLIRDISELRRRDRLLISKDATIREIHHRVKNNLQTISSLLRLQARRIDSEEATAALEEAVRRVGSIAIVHETLSQAVEEAVDFDEIVDRLRVMVTDMGSTGGAVTSSRVGQFGVLPAELATPLAMVLTELLQNATEHAFDGGPGHVEVSVCRETRESGEELQVRVTDDGRGIPDTFDLERSGSLGLSIVRTLVESELGGALVLGSATDGGACVDVRIPLV